MLVVFLQPIYYDIDIAATHIPGVANCTADRLSRNNMSQYFLLNPQVNQKPTSLPQSLIKIMTTPGMDCMDISSFHRAVQHYYINGLAPSTHRYYKAGQSQYLAFCCQIQCSAIPTSESTMLLFVAYLAKERLSYTTIKVYLPAIHNLHTTASMYHTYQEQLTTHLEQVLQETAVNSGTN